MASDLPPRLFYRTTDYFQVVNTRDFVSDVKFDIISYTWGDTVSPYSCGIPGVSWKVTIPPRKIDDIKRLMIYDNIEYLWVDCVCLHQEDDREKGIELPNMYKYYKRAQKCYVLMDMDEVWNPQDIVNNLKFIDHVLSNMEGTSLTPESDLTENMIKRLSDWESQSWSFPVDASTARAAAIDMGVLNCYSACISQVKSVFKNAYFTRVWVRCVRSTLKNQTFQEMLLGKNITIFGINNDSITCIGQLENWMDLATDCKDKAYKLREWIEKSRHQTPASVLTILKIINDDYWALSFLQIQVLGISSARMDIITGGSSWWHENYKGVSNVFSAASITARKCKKKGDIFLGLLGVFSDLFTPEETLQELMGDDMERISFAFFKQLSIKTGHAWTKLAVSSKARDDWGWIPVVANTNRDLMTTDCFSGVVRLGKLGKNGEVKTTALYHILWSPRQYMTVQLNREDPSNNEFGFVFHGCNCGKKWKPWFSRTPEEIPPEQTQPRIVAGDETGQVLVQCATILGSLMDPGNDVVKYRKRLLEKFRPYWKVSDPIAKTADWIDRCVNGTEWQEPDPDLFKVHNRSVNYEMRAIFGCGSRLQNESTANISCTVVVNCGCKIIAPFSLMFSAITAVEGSSLGGASASLEEDTGRIILSDGLGLVQVGDIDKLFSLAAFQGNVKSYSSHAKDCRTTRLDKPVSHDRDWPRARVLLKLDVFKGLDQSNGQTDMQNISADMQDISDDLDSQPSKSRMRSVHESLTSLPSKISMQAVHESFSNLPGKINMQAVHEGFSNLPGKINMQAVHEGFSSLNSKISVQDIQESLPSLPEVMHVYGYVNTEGSGNLLICKKGFDPYRIVGACIDESMTSPRTKEKESLRTKDKESPRKDDEESLQAKKRESLWAKTRDSLSKEHKVIIR